MTSVERIMEYTQIASEHDGLGKMNQKQEISPNEWPWKGQIVFKNYNSSGGSLTERVRITGSGNILAQKCISVGAATPSSDGAGITFPASQSASTNANTLDDYEEGTWTPIDSSGSGLTFTGVSAYYTKIGDMVFATFALTFPGSSSSATNVLGGLPFTSAAGNAMNAFNVSYTSYSPGLMAPIDASLTSFTLYDTTTTNSINNTSLVSKAIRGTCIYKVA